MSAEVAQQIAWVQAICTGVHVNGTHVQTHQFHHFPPWSGCACAAQAGWVILGEIQALSILWGHSSVEREEMLSCTELRFLCLHYPGNHTANAKQGQEQMPGLQWKLWLSSLCMDKKSRLCWRCSLIIYVHVWLAVSDNPAEASVCVTWRNCRCNIFFFNCGYLQWLLGLKKGGKIHHVQCALLRSLGGSMHTDVTPRQQLTIKPASKPRTISKYWPHTQIGNYCLACCLLPITVQTIHWGKRWVLPISKSLSLKYFPASLSPATEK